MSPVIRIPDNVYSRLSKHAQGFDTPANVIEKLLNSYEGVEPEETELPSTEKPSKARNTAKYVFGDHVYGKGRLVLAVVKAYVAENPDTSFSDLQKQFPRNLQGSSGVFSKKGKAQEIFQRTGHKRHFIKPSELVEISDCTIAVSTEWGAGNIDKLVAQAQALGYEITEENG